MLRAAPCNVSSAFAESAASDSISLGPISALVEVSFIPSNRARCRARAAATASRARFVSPEPLFVCVESVSGAISPTDTHISMRSATGPDILRRYFSTRCGMHRHRGLPQNPQGHGLRAAISMKFAGNTAEPLERAMDITLSSSGSRSALMTSRWNSGNSSAKSTPRCASVASPGRMPAEPPPMSAAYEDV